MQADHAHAQDQARSRDIQRAGHVAEASWKTFLEKWGPGLPIKTRKYIVGPRGDSNEVDLVILRPDYPAHLRDNEEILYSGVVAAFSCKLTFRQRDLVSVLEQKARLIAIGPSDHSEYRNVLRGAFPFGLLCHSSEFSSEEPADIDAKIMKFYNDLRKEGGARPAPILDHPQHELDSLTIADSSFFRATRFARIPRNPWDAVIRDAEVASMFAPVHHDVRPAGVQLVQLVTWLYQQIHPGEESPLGTLLEQIGGMGTTFGWNVSWPGMVLDEARAHINKYDPEDPSGVFTAFQ